MSHCYKHCKGTRLVYKTTLCLRGLLSEGQTRPCLAITAGKQDAGGCPRAAARNCTARTGSVCLPLYIFAGLVLAGVAWGCFSPCHAVPAAEQSPVQRSFSAWWWWSPKPTGVGVDVARRGEGSDLPEVLSQACPSCVRGAGHQQCPWVQWQCPEELGSQEEAELIELFLGLFQPTGSARVLPSLSICSSISDLDTQGQGFTLYSSFLKSTFCREQNL